MLRVPTVSAKPGMVLALPIYHPRRHDTMLLKAGIALDARSIKRLGEIRLREMWIRYPGVEFAREYICPSVFEAQASLTWQVGRALEAVSEGAFARLEYGEYRAAIGGVLSSLLARPGAALFIPELAGGEEIGCHSVIVASGVHYARLDAPGIEAARAAGNKMITLDATETARWKAAAAPIAEAWVKEMAGKGYPAADMLTDAKALIVKYAGAE